ncbi:MAG TPA: DoxX family protein [Chloroflexota bacterium]|nr:DoxX family protein [Chloroflexota bacterium]
MKAFLRLAEPSPELKEWGLAVLRVVVGFTFLMHGWQKLFMLGLAGTVAMFGQMGVPVPELTGPLVGALELVGGAALLVGLGTRWLAALLALDMLVAILLVHLPHGFFAPMGAELPLVLLGGAAALVLAGPGAFALDRLVARSGEQVALAR